MRFTSIFLAAGLAVFASAQSASENTAPTTTDAAAAAASSAQAKILSCLDACDDADVNCKAQCMAVPFPNEQQVNATTTCVAACDQGEGSEADIAAYSRCVENCIGQNYFTPTAGTPSPTGAAGGGGSNGNGNNNNNNNNNGDNNNDNNGDSPSNTGNDQESGTGTGPSPSESTGAAAVMGVTGGVVGLAGFVAAVMAL